MLNRLSGLETEYSLRFQPLVPGGYRLPNTALFENILKHLREKLPLAKAVIADYGWYLAQGGSIKLERIPFLAMLPTAGLVEGATPECRGPRSLLLQQRVQDVLFSRAAAASGPPHGVAALLKNNHDGHGNPFGSHENYEVTIAGHRGMFWWRAGLMGLMPLLVPLVFLAVLLLCLLFLIICLPLLLIRGGLRRPPPVWWDQLLVWLMRICMLPPVLLAEVFIRLTAFRRHRRQLLAFLITRPLFAGAGMIDAKGRLHLSPRAISINALCSTTTECGRGIFNFGHVWKGLLGSMLGERGSYRRLFQPRQRLQITCGDSNMAQFAEYLKLGTTMLVLDAIDAGYLTDAPRVYFPLWTLRTFSRDPDLRTKAWLNRGRRWTALEIQRYYLETCRRFVDQSPSRCEEASTILNLWEETLDSLAENPRKLVGKVDWVTKRYLLTEGAQGSSPEALRKLDLRYHELTREGYYLQLEAAGIAPTLVEPEEVLAAVGVPPEDTPAAQRGRLIRKYHNSAEPFAVSWNLAVIGTGPDAKIINLGVSSAVKDADQEPVSMGTPSDPFEQE